jgi:hypothetical protein
MPYPLGHEDWTIHALHGIHQLSSCAKAVAFLQEKILFDNVARRWLDGVAHNDPWSFSALESNLVG